MVKINFYFMQIVGETKVWIAKKKPDLFLRRGNSNNFNRREDCSRLCESVDEDDEDVNPVANVTQASARKEKMMDQGELAGKKHNL